MQTALKEQRQLGEVITNFCMARHPEFFLLKCLRKNPVCQICLGSGGVMKCAGKCKQYFHRNYLGESLPNAHHYNTILEQRKRKEDFNKVDGNSILCIIEDNLEKIQCVSCTTSTIANVCFVCSHPGADCLQCGDRNCGKAYH